MEKEVKRGLLALVAAWLGINAALMAVVFMGDIKAKLEKKKEMF